MRDEEIKQNDSIIFITISIYHFIPYKVQKIEQIIDDNNTCFFCN